MTTAVSAGTRRARVLEHLAEHPGQSSTQIRRAIGARSQIGYLLQDMAYRGQLVAESAWRPDQGRHVSLWHVAPPGTVPPPRPALDPAQQRHRRELDTRAARARRARARVCGPQPVAPALPLATVPCSENPALFFPATGDEEAQAIALCHTCRFRQPCLDRALANHEAWGIWGGVNVEKLPRTERTKAS